jgi:outer membrane lipoprotein-sorting protein
MKSTARLMLVFVLVLLIFGSGTDSHPQAKNSQAALDQVLAHMEEVGKKFRSFAANFTQKTYTALLKEFGGAESGRFLYSRAKDGTALLKKESKTPAEKILTIKGGTALLYQPSLKEATRVNLGANKDKAEYLALGLGQSPAKLRETFDIEYLGEEAVDGTPCSILQFKPKSHGGSGLFSSITIWVSKSDSLPVQQKLLQPGGDYTLNKFSAEKFNPSIAESEFEQKLPKDVAIQEIK